MTMTKPLLLLVALTLASLHVVPVLSCKCIRTVSNRIPLRIIQKIEVIPISGYCRRTEIIVTRRNGSKMCVTPGMQWVSNMLSNLQNRNMTSSSTTPSSTDSATN